MKKVLAIILALVLVFTLVACGQGGDDEDTVKITMIGGMPGGPAWGPASEGFYKACEELGWKGTYLAPTTAANQTEICDLVITAVTNGADVILALMFDEEMFGDLVKEYREQGIVLIGANAGVEATNAKIGSDTTELGQMFAQAVDQLVPENEHVYSVTMTTLISTATSAFDIAYKAALNELRGEANCTYYDMLECQSSTETAYSNFAAFKLANPECNVFISQNSYAGLGIASYIQEYGLQDEIYAIGIDDSAEILQYVKDGLLDATVSQNFYNIGYGGVYLAKTILDGGEYVWNNSAGAKLLMPEDVEAWATKLGYTLN